MSIETAEEEAGSGWDTKAMPDVSLWSGRLRPCGQRAGTECGLPLLDDSSLPRRRAAPWQAKRLSGLLSARPARDGKRAKNKQGNKTSEPASARGAQKRAAVCWGDLQKMGKGCSGKAWPQESVFLIRVAGGEAHRH